MIGDAGAARLLAIAGGDDDARLVHLKVEGFRRFVLLYGAARSWTWLALGADLDPTVLAASALVLTACAGLAWHPAAARWAPCLALPVLLLQLLTTLPITNNHFFLELLCVTLLCLAGPAPADERLVVQGLAWITALVLLHTGLQKVFYGLYFRGELLAFMVGQGGRFADLFRWLLPDGEIARLASYDALRVGAGPYRVVSLPLLAASNVVYLAEIVLAPLLLWKRTRSVAAIAAIALVLTIQLGARELGFVLLFTNLLLLFLPLPAVRTLLPLAAVVLAWAVGAAFGWLPGTAFLQTGNL